MKSFNGYFVAEEPEQRLKFLIYCATLKKDYEKSNSHTIALMVQQALEEFNCDCEIVVANELHFEPGVDIVDQYGNADDLTNVLEKIKDCDGLIVATPIWWGVYSSYVQALFERMSYFDDQYIKRNVSMLYGKTFGAIVSGADDGWQQIQGLMGSFVSQLGFTLPPEAFVSDENQSKNKIKQDNELDERIKVFVRNQVLFAEMLKISNFSGVQSADLDKTGETYT
jgi:multimeric flavodoxin WrbA